MHSKSRFLLFALLLLLTAALGCSEGETYVLDGVYTFSLPGLDGTPMNFADLRGKGVMVNVWATWCGPCAKEIPEFVKLYDKYKDQGFEIWGVSTDVQGRSIVEPFVEEYNMNYPVLLSSQADLAKIFGYIRGYPTTLFFDKDGKLVQRIDGEPFVPEGMTLESFFEEKIKAVLPQ